MVVDRLRPVNGQKAEPGRLRQVALPWGLLREDERALAVRGESGLALRAPADPYEKKFMPGKGMILARDRARMPRSLSVLMGLSVLGVAGMAAAGGAAIVGGILTAGALAFTWLSMSVLRVAISEGTVHIQYGLFGPEIPIAAIEHVERFQYEWTKYGGWGIRRAWGGEWMYNVPGDGGNAVRIIWRDAKGRRHSTCIGSKNADGLYQAIVSARRALGGTTPPSLAP